MTVIYKIFSIKEKIIATVSNEVVEKCFGSNMESNKIYRARRERRNSLSTV